MVILLNKWAIDQVDIEDRQTLDDTCFRQVDNRYMNIDHR